MSNKKRIELLTPLKMRRMFGDNYDHIVYYNYDSGKLVNTSTQDSSAIKHTIENAAELQLFLERQPSFKGMDIVACCTMCIPYKKFPGVCKLCEITPTLGTNDGDTTIGTLIFRNKKTGKIITPPQYWLGCERYINNSEAKELGTRGFAYDIKVFPEILRILRSIHIYNK